MRSDYFILRGKSPVAATLLEWGRWFETAERHVALDTVGQYWISTVFLGLDHNFIHQGPPILFETMVFDRNKQEEGEYTRRYSTWDEAEAGHANTVRAIRAKIHGIKRVK